MNHDAERDILNIQCEDVTLRAYRAEDLRALYDLTQQPEIMEFLPDWNVPIELRRRFLTEYEIPENQHFLSAVADGGTVGSLRLRLGVVLRETGELIGWCCTGPKEELPAPSREIVFAISNRHRNRGYTTQAACGMVRYLFEKTDAEQLNAIALTRNGPSNRVIEKCGFHRVGSLDIEGEPYHHYMISRDAWQEHGPSV